MCVGGQSGGEDGDGVIFASDYWYFVLIFGLMMKILKTKTCLLPLALLLSASLLPLNTFSLLLLL